jgi:hypothetical protein
LAQSELPPEVLENKRKAFELAESLATLLSTLATGTIVLSGIFIKDILATNNEGLEMQALLFLAWATLGVAGALGPVVIGQLVWDLDGPASTQNLTVQSARIRLSSAVQIVFFYGGILFFAIFVGTNL